MRVLLGRTPRQRGLRGDSDVDWSDAESVIEHQVGYSRTLAGDRRPFDEATRRKLVRGDVGRARNIAALRNHNVIPNSKRSYGALSTITAPTLVIHGTADPMFPPGHGEALAAEIPGARLLMLDGAGHGVDQTDWDTIAAAIVEHTAPTDQAHARCRSPPHTSNRHDTSCDASPSGGAIWRRVSAQPSAWDH